MPLNIHTFFLVIVHLSSASLDPKVNNLSNKSEEYTAIH